MRFFRRSCEGAVALLILVTGGTAAASTIPATALTAALRGDLIRYLDTEGAKDHFSALSLRVSYPQRPALAVSAGTTTYGGSTPVMNDARWQIGSNTKAFTSVVVLRLAAEKKLSLLDRLGHWLPDYPAWRDVTVRQLLSMTSGIPDYAGQPAFATALQAGPDGGRVTARHLIAYVKDEPLGPHTFAYSNTNYLLAQLIIERATHHRYFDEVTRRILTPLGMRDTCFAPETCPARIAPRLPEGYSMQAGLPELVGKPVPPLALSWAQGAGGLVSTLEDMITWDRALYGGRELPAAQQRELESLISLTTSKPIKVVTAGDPYGFGLGIAQKTDPMTGVTWAYQGGTLGFRVLHLYFPGSGLLIAVAVNSNVDVSTLPDLADTLYRTLSGAGRQR